MIPPRLAKALQPSEPTEYRGKRLFRFAAQPELSSMLWCPAYAHFARFVDALDALKLSDLDAIPLLPPRGRQCGPRRDQRDRGAHQQAKPHLGCRRLSWRPTTSRNCCRWPLPPELAGFLTNDCGGPEPDFAGRPGVRPARFPRPERTWLAFWEKELTGLRVSNIQAKVVAPTPDSAATTTEGTTLHLRGTAQTFREALTRWGN